VEVIDLRTLLPVDKDAIVKSVQKTSKALIVYEDNLTMGYGAEVAAIIADDCFEYLDGPVRRMAGPDIPAMPFNHAMQEHFMPNPDKIAAAIRQIAAY
jgi:2-oxoisovalerate dehydrogenase E1 component beta subunit